MTVALRSSSFSDAAARLGAWGVDGLRPFVIPMRTRFRGVTERSGWVLHGSAGWAEWSPFPEYGPAEAAPWLTAAVMGATRRAPNPVRDAVPVNVTVPAVGPDDAFALVAAARCSTAKVKVGEPGQDLASDAARVSAVRSALGPKGRIRIDANAVWDVPTAVHAVNLLDRAAGGLEYVEQPCRSLGEMAEVRRRARTPLAVDESVRRDGIRDRASLRAASDVVILKVQPSAGTTRALDLALDIGLPVVVSSALESSFGLAHGVLFAAALPELPYACGLGTALLLARDASERPLTPYEGAIAVAEARRVISSAPAARGVPARLRVELERRLAATLDACT